jgi:hypothetical protein
MNAMKVPANFLASSNELFSLTLTNTVENILLIIITISIYE